MLSLEKKLFSQVESKLLTEDFYSLLHSKVKEGLKLYKLNPELIKLVSEYTGVPEDKLKLIWNDVYRLIVKLYYRRVKIKKRNVGGVRLNTLANSLYFAIYERYEHQAPEIMYTILEPYMVSALQNPENDVIVEKTRLLFLPIAPENLDEILELLKEILSSNRRILCNDTVVSALEILCSQSSKLPSSKSSFNTYSIKDTEYCIKNLKKIVSEVCTHESG